MHKIESKTPIYGRCKSCGLATGYSKFRELAILIDSQPNNIGVCDDCIKKSNIIKIYADALAQLIIEGKILEEDYKQISLNFSNFLLYESLREKTDNNQILDTFKQNINQKLGEEYVKREKTEKKYNNDEEKIIPLPIKNATAEEIQDWQYYSHIINFLKDIKKAPLLDREVDTLILLCHYCKISNFWEGISPPPENILLANILKIPLELSPKIPRKLREFETKLLKDRTFKLFLVFDIWRKIYPDIHTSSLLFVFGEYYEINYMLLKEVLVHLKRYYKTPIEDLNPRLNAFKKFQKLKPQIVKILCKTKDRQMRIQDLADKVGFTLSEMHLFIDIFQDQFEKISERNAHRVYVRLKMVKPINRSKTKPTLE